jgi:hypothetical protein
MLLVLALNPLAAQNLLAGAARLGPQPCATLPHSRTRPAPPQPPKPRPRRRLAPAQLARRNVRQEEDAGGGGVSWGVYGSLFTRSWPPLLVLGLLALMVSPGISVLANLVLARW